MARKKRVDPVVILIVLLVPLAVVATSTYAGPLISGAMFLRWPRAAPSTTHDLPSSYEPVHQGHFDLGTGLYIREDDDFVLHSTPSFVFRRTYRTHDSRSREFGVGTTHNGEWLLIGDRTTFQWATLVFPGGGRIEFQRISAGTSSRNALFEHWTSPTSFGGARLGWSGSEWLLRLRDGSLARIAPCSGPPWKCTVLDIRDWDGHQIRFERDAAMTLLKIDIGAESIDFGYDDQLRVIEARDSSGRELRYTYDSAGRLVRSAASDGRIRLYAYDAMHRMTRVEEPGRIVENAYDADGLLTKQLVWSAEGSRHVLGEAPYIYEIAYKKEDGRVRQTDVRQSSGEHKRAIFDQAGYVVSETYAPDTPTFIMVKYQRDAVNHVVNAVTVTCPSGRWRSTHTERVEPGHEHEVAARLTAQWCEGSQRQRHSRILR
jgi:YD repeat-containing protein